LGDAGPGATRQGHWSSPQRAFSAAAQVSKAWPFEEARKLLKRYPDGKPGGAPVLFETGYGPSGLPHIGTFQEVLRTTLVRRAYESLTGGAPTRLVAFSATIWTDCARCPTISKTAGCWMPSRPPAEPHSRSVQRTKALRTTTTPCCVIP
jgi:hypothetical protein